MLAGAAIFGAAACGSPGDAYVGESGASARERPARGGAKGAGASRAAVDSAGQRSAPRPASGKAADGVTGGAVQPRQVRVNGIDLTGIGYDVGNPAATIVLVNFSDFGCPFCGTFARESYPGLEREFVRTGKVFFKYVPFVMGMFPNGEQAARAAECAADQGSFWPMHDQLYGAQREWKSSRSPELHFGRYAAALGLDTVRFGACHAGGETDGRTGRANDRAARLGIRATPTFFINDQQIEGALPLEQFRRILTRLTS